MKLTELHEIDILWEGELEGEEYAFYVQLEEGRARAGFGAKRGGVLSKAGKGLLKFAKNPIVAGLAAGYAIDAYGKYKKNKRMTTHFFARGTQEKKMYKEIVDTLMKTGKYRKVREKYVDGGYLWELKKIH